MNNQGSKVTFDELKSKQKSLLEKAQEIKQKQNDSDDGGININRFLNR